MNPIDDQHLLDLHTQGISDHDIARQLRESGHKTSATTVGRRLKKLVGARRVGRRKSLPTAPTSTSTPSIGLAGDVPTDEQIAETSDLRTLDGWLDITGDMARAAKAEGNA